MNKIRIINKNDNILNEIKTEYEYEYEVGEIITVNSTVNCKCKEVINGLENNIYVFVQGWTEYGF